MSGKIRFLVIYTFLFLFVFPAFGKVFSSGGTYSVGFRDRLFAVHFIDDEDGWIVGGEGLILHTQDGGKTWEQKSSVRHSTSFNDITFVGKDGWIVGGEGVILHSDEGGRRWKEQESGSRARLMAVAFLDAKRGAAVGQQTALWTEDGGERWQAAPLDWTTILPEALIERGVISPNFYSLFFLDETHGWMAGDNGMVFFSSDGGKHWEPLRIGIYPPLYSIFFKDEGKGFAAGQRGVLLHTQDGGRSWQHLNSTTDNNLFKITMAGSYGMAAGDRGTIIETIDGGKTWKEVSLTLRPPFPWFIDLSLLTNPAMKAICVGEGIIKELPIPSVQKNSMNRQASSGVEG